MEPAREGNYIIFGPNVHNFEEVYRMLENLKIATKIHSIKNIKKIFLKKIDFTENKKVNKKLKILGNKIISKNILEIKKFI